MSAPDPARVAPRFGVGTPPDGVLGDAPQLPALAERITEDALQLLFAAHQDIADFRLGPSTADVALLHSAEQRVLDAVSVLRVVAAAVRRSADDRATSRPHARDVWPTGT